MSFDPYYAVACICTVDFMKEVTDSNEEILKLRTEHISMKEALEWYADEENYDQNENAMHPEILDDEGEKARVVLSTLTKDSSCTS